jgi:hypothetical protein
MIKTSKSQIKDTFERMEEGEDDVLVIFETPTSESMEYSNFLVVRVSRMDIEHNQTMFHQVHQVGVTICASKECCKKNGKSRLLGFNVKALESDIIKQLKTIEVKEYFAIAYIAKVPIIVAKASNKAFDERFDEKIVVTPNVSNGETVSFTCTNSVRDSPSLIHTPFLFDKQYYCLECLQKNISSRDIV